MKILLYLIVLLSVETSAQESVYKYKEEEINFHNGPYKLAGTLFLPNSDKKLPAIIIVHGSGKEHRKLRGYRAMAKMFAENGFVCLIYDKRGVGDSDGIYVETGDYTSISGDISEAVNTVRSRKEVDFNWIGLYGHSQGGWTAPLAAAASRSVSFIIVTCGGGITPRDQVIYNHFTVNMRERGLPEQSVDSITAFVKKLYSYLGTGTGYQELLPAFNNARKEKWFPAIEQMGIKQLPPPGMLKDPAFNFFKYLNYDPQSTLRGLEIPTLVILGKVDKQVPSVIAEKIWKDSYHASGKENKLTVITLENEGHNTFDIGAEIKMKDAFSKPMLEWLRTLK